MFSPFSFLFFSFFSFLAFLDIPDFVICTSRQMGTSEVVTFRAIWLTALCFKCGITLPGKRDKVRSFV